MLWHAGIHSQGDVIFEVAVPDQDSGILSDINSSSLAVVCPVFHKAAVVKCRPCTALEHDDPCSTKQSIQKQHWVAKACFKGIAMW